MQKSRISDLLILFQLYLIDKSTKKRFPMFSVTIEFCKYKQITMFNHLKIEDTNC